MKTANNVYCQFTTSNDLDIDDCFLPKNAVRIGKNLDVEIDMEDPMKIIGISEESDIHGDIYYLVTLTEVE